MKKLFALLLGCTAVFGFSVQTYCATMRWDYPEGVRAVVNSSEVNEGDRFEMLFYPQNKAGEGYIIPKEITSIRTLASANYNNLKELYFYNKNVSLTTLSVGYGNIIFNCYKGSTAEAYAKDSFEVKYITDMGDADGSGTITANDASIVFAKSLNSDIAVQGECDVNGDGVITSADAAYILQKALDADILYPAENNQILAYNYTSLSRGTSDSFGLNYVSNADTRLAVIRSEEELKAFYEANSDALDAEKIDAFIKDFSGENVFDDSILLMAYYDEPCLYTKQEVSDVSVVNGALTVSLKCTYPAVSYELIDFVLNAVKVDKNVAFDSVKWVKNNYKINDNAGENTDVEEFVETYCIGELC